MEDWVFSIIMKYFINISNIMNNNIKKGSVFPAGFEPATLRVWGARDNHYTTETYLIIFFGDLMDSLFLFS